MEECIAALVPTCVLDHYKQEANNQTFDASVLQTQGKLMEAATGTLLFPDISGFTKLTEAVFAEHATNTKKGAQMLYHVLNTKFMGIMLEIVRESGGDVLKFCGDALQIFFRDGPSEYVEPEDGPLEAAATSSSLRRMTTTTAPMKKLPITRGAHSVHTPKSLCQALTCAVKLQAALDNFDTGIKTASHNIFLRLKILVGYGHVQFVHVGARSRLKGVRFSMLNPVPSMSSDHTRWEFLAAGPVMIQIMDTEKYARPGDIVLSREVLNVIAQTNFTSLDPLCATMISDGYDSSSLTCTIKVKWIHSLKPDNQLQHLIAILSSDTSNSSNSTSLVSETTQMTTALELLTDMDFDDNDDGDNNNGDGGDASNALHLNILDDDLSSARKGADDDKPQDGVAEMLTNMKSSEMRQVLKAFIEPWVLVRVGNHLISRSSNDLREMTRTSSRRGASSLTTLTTLRHVTVMFVNIVSMLQSCRNIDGQLDSLETLYATLLEIITSHSGQLYKFVFDDKGLIFICVFGLEANASGASDAVEATRAAIEIASQLDALGHVPAIGVASGDTFIGAVGTLWRCEFAIYGDAVNVAARLMTQATILLNNTTTATGTAMATGASTIALASTTTAAVQSVWESMTHAKRIRRVVVVDKVTKLACGDVLEFEKHCNLVQLKGKKGKIEVYFPLATAPRAVGVRVTVMAGQATMLLGSATPRAAPQPRRVFAGRHSMVSTITDIVEAAEKNNLDLGECECALVLCQCMAGMGKHALADHVSSILSHKGIHCVTASASNDADSVFGFLSEALHELYQIMNPLGHQNIRAFFPEELQDDIPLLEKFLDITFGQFGNDSDLEGDNDDVSHNTSMTTIAENNHQQQKQQQIRPHRQNNSTETKDKNNSNQGDKAQAADEEVAVGDPGQQQQDTLLDLIVFFLQLAQSKLGRVALILHNSHLLSEAGWRLVDDIHRSVPLSLLLVCMRPLPVVPCPAVDYGLKLLAAQRNTDYSMCATVVRPKSMARSESMFPLQVRTGKHATTLIEFDNFKPKEVNQLMCLMLESETVPDEVVEYVHSHTEGHPLHTTHLILHLVQGKFISKTAKGVVFQPPPESSNDIPQSLESLFTRMVDGMDHTVQEVLKVAAIMGRTFNQRLLYLICSSHLPKSFTASDLDSVLGVLIDMGVVMNVMSSDPASQQDIVSPTHRFCHETLRKGVCSMLIDSFQKRIHSDIAAIMEQELATRAAEANDTVPEGQLLKPHTPEWRQAREHFRLTRRRDFTLESILIDRLLNAGDLSKALQVAELAADQAFASNDNPRAIQLYNSALGAIQAWTRVDNVDLSHVIEARIHQRLGELMWRGGKRDQCKLHCTRTVEIYSVELPSKRRAKRAIRRAGREFREESGKARWYHRLYLLAAKCFSRNNRSSTVPTSSTDIIVVSKALRLLLECAWHEGNIPHATRLACLLWSTTGTNNLTTSTEWTTVCGFIGCLLALMHRTDLAEESLKCAKVAIEERLLSADVPLERSHASYCEGFIRLLAGDFTGCVDHFFRSGEAVNNNSLPSDRSEAAQLLSAWVLQTQGDQYSCARLVIAMRHAAQHRSSRDIMAQCDFFLATSLLLLGQLEMAETAARSFQDLDSSVAGQSTVPSDVLLVLCEATKLFLEGGSCVAQARSMIFPLIGRLAKPAPNNMYLGIVFQILGMIAFGADAQLVGKWQTEPAGSVEDLPYAKKATSHAMTRRSSAIVRSLGITAQQSRDSSRMVITKVGNLITQYGANMKRENHSTPAMTHDNNIVSDSETPVIANPRVSHDSAHTINFESRPLTAIERKTQTAVINALTQYASMFPHLNPLLLRLNGIQLFSKGQKSNAETMWVQSLRLARDQRMMFDLACAYAVLGTHGAPARALLNMEKWHILLQHLKCPPIFTKPCL
eukprot:c10557_g1_i1.p1 GENE.c10557_g1_i1~~c10557_g1_i1.p1  ORF type:complete len:1907 (+),score=489.57 c10557_g1_i1:75-5795(+)